jgi:hypothetical protein
METWHGTIRTSADAIKIFEACRLGLLPRVQRRLSERERQAIRPGSVFVWDEHESGMRRWTDGKAWSASRVAGSFLTYREIEGKRGAGFGGAAAAKNAAKTPPETTKSDEEKDEAESGSSSDRYKRNGLMKQSFSITTTNDHHLHLISYSAPQKPDEPELPTPSTDAMLSGVRPAKSLYPESSIGDSPSRPAFTSAPMGGAFHHSRRPIQQQQQHQQQHPHHHHHYPQQRTDYMHQASRPMHNGAAWPPSPLASPPFGQHSQPFSPAPPSFDRRHEQPPHQTPQQQQQQQQQQQPPYYPSYPHEPRSFPPSQQRSPIYGRHDAMPLPPPQDHDQRYTTQPYCRYPQAPPPQPAARPEDSYVLAARAAQVMVGPPHERQPLSHHEMQQRQDISLPPITTMAGGSPATPVSAVCKLEPTSPRMPYTPPLGRRPMTESPPQSARSDVAFPHMPLARSATSISSLLPPAHPSVAGTRSEGGGSPQRAMADAVLMRTRGYTTSEDSRALSVLNKSFGTTK